MVRLYSDIAGEEKGVFDSFFGDDDDDKKKQPAKKTNSSKPVEEEPGVLVPQLFSS